MQSSAIFFGGAFAGAVLAAAAGWDLFPRERAAERQLEAVGKELAATREQLQRSTRLLEEAQGARGRLETRARDLERSLESTQAERAIARREDDAQRQRQRDLERQGQEMQRSVAEAEARVRAVEAELTAARGQARAADRGLQGLLLSSARQLFATPQGQREAGLFWRILDGLESRDDKLALCLAMIPANKGLLLERGEAADGGAGGGDGEVGNDLGSTPRPAPASFHEALRSEESTP